MDSFALAAFFTESASPWDEPITNAISPAPLLARSAISFASSSLENCLPSTQSAARYSPLRRLERMAVASLSRALLKKEKKEMLASVKLKLKKKRESQLL